MPKYNGDWTHIEIFNALKDKNISITELAKQRKSLKFDMFTLDKAISNALDIPLDELWPSRYSKDN